ncbi:hypothetical protein M0D70_03050 [Acinetobacter portensis]|uniref:Uncharacterized protein n=2 Tax=Acinetobacter TaxID=469 RepID=A0A6L6GGL9_9GAMM|nr:MULTISPECIES: hypothetical protein [Acinetobacter]MCK7608433.1 hypothetical protein [Acinetobacter portensis]MCK7639152.1 hypothetical protein [Acinetobacter portensis]MDY6483662.1 hypothetical protein [Acinetobacter faecalis]MDY6487362.1 hypothetical protein [Acinetobacter faecalis]MDY6489947.1 hypothetical protein [Acinetobacter faecalis]
MKLKSALYGIPFILLTTISHAGPYQHNLEQCLDNNISKNDKSQLAKYIFFSIAANPDFSKYVNIPANELISSDKKIAKIYERILIKNCSTEIRDVIKNEGTNALESAFEFLGRTSMVNIMSNETVQNRMLGPSQHMNDKKISKTIKEQYPLSSKPD